jgi:hypothetical protein
VVVWRGDSIPGRHFAGFLREMLRKTPSIDGRVRAALEMEKPGWVYWSVLENGKLALLNFDDRPAQVRLAGGRMVTLGPYEPMLVENGN